MIKFSKWYGRVSGGEARNEVILPPLDGTFGGVAAMVVQRHALKCDIVLVKRVFEVVGALVINDVEGGRVAIVL